MNLNRHSQEYSSGRLKPELHYNFESVVRGTSHISPEKVIKHCHTVYCFSSENWHVPRPLTQNRNMANTAVVLQDDWLTLGCNGLAVSGTVKRYRAVKDLVHDDGEAVHISFLSADWQSGDSRSLWHHQLWRRPQQRCNIIIIIRTMSYSTIN